MLSRRFGLFLSSLTLTGGTAENVTDPSHFVSPSQLELVPGYESSESLLGLCFDTSIQDGAASVPWFPNVELMKAPSPLPDLVTATSADSVSNHSPSSAQALEENSVADGLQQAPTCNADEGPSLQLGDTVLTAIFLENLTIRSGSSLSRERGIELGSNPIPNPVETTDRESSIETSTCPRSIEFPWVSGLPKRSEKLAFTTRQPATCWTWCSVRELIVEQHGENGTTTVPLLPSCEGMSTVFPKEHYNIWMKAVVIPEVQGTCTIEEGTKHALDESPKQQDEGTEPTVRRPQGVATDDFDFAARRESYDYVDHRDGSRPRAKLRFSTIVVFVFALLILKTVGTIFWEQYTEEKSRQAALLEAARLEEEERKRADAAQKAKRRKRRVFKRRIGNDLQRPLLEVTGLNQVELYSLTMDLTTAVEVSLSLSHRRSQRNALKEIFRLQVELRDEENKTHQYQIDMDAERDPESSWPNYRYQMSQAQHTFIRKELTNMLDAAEMPCLRRLRLVGFQRVRGFYQRVVEVLKTKKAIEHLDMEWKAFLEDVQMDQCVYRLFSTLESINLSLRGINQHQAQLCGLFLASLKNLRHLHVDADLAGSVAVPWIVPALANTKQVEDFVWIGSMARVPAKEIEAFCGAVRKLPLKALNATWGPIEESHVGILLGGSNTTLEKLTLGSVGLPSLPDVERFVRSNEALSELDITLLGCEAAPVLKGMKDHPSITKIALKEIFASEGTAEALRAVCESDRSKLRDLELGMARGSSEFLRKLPQALAPTSGLRTFSLHGVPKFGKETSGSFATIFRNNTNISSVTIEFDGSLSQKSSETICGGLSGNTQTKQLHLVGHVPTESLEPVFDLLEHNNLDLTRFTYLQSTKSLLVKEGLKSRAMRQAIEHLLLLNRLGRRGFLDPSFRHELMPLVLAKVNNLHQTTNVFHILSRKPDLILPPVP